MGERKVRKERSDKKKAINPTIDLSLYDQLMRLSYICNRPLKDITETLCEEGLNSKDIIDSISYKFRRHYIFNEFITFQGKLDLPIQRDVIGSDQHQINLRLKRNIYEQICLLSYSLDVPKTRSVYILLEKSFRDPTILGHLLTKFVQQDLDPQRIQQLKILLRYVNRQGRDELTLNHLLVFLLDRLGDGAKRITDVITEWMEGIKK